MRRWQSWAWMALLLGAAIGSLVGWGPALLAALGLIAWTWRLMPRWGFGAALALAVAVGASGLFLVMVVTPLTPIPSPLVVTAVLLCAAAAPIAFRGRAMDNKTHTDRWVIAASLLGSVAWLGGLLVASFTPGSSARSWAVLDDSTLDLWNIRHYADYNGFPVAYNSNSRPFEHAISTAMLPFGTPLDGSGAELAGEITAHASHWTLAIVLSCALAGSVAAALATHSGTRSRVAPAIAAAIASVAVLAGPATGFFVLRGQINASLVVALVLGSVALALQARRGPAIVLAGLIASTTVLLLTWTPFAAVPGLLACTVAVTEFAELRTAWRSRERSALIPLGAALAWFVWAFATISLQEYIGLAAVGEGGRQARAATATILPAPYSWAFTFACLGTVVVLASVNARAARWRATVSATTAAGLVAGAVPIFMARGGISGDLEYYSSRYVQMSTVCASILAIGLLVGFLSQPRARLGFVSAIIATAGIVTLAASAPLDPRVEQWQPAPALVVSGNYFGPDRAVYDRIVSYASEESGIRIPWNLELPWDTRVRYALTIDEEDRGASFHTDERSSLRNRLDDGIDRICEIGDAHDERVTVVTADPDLEGSAKQTCATQELAKVVFVLEPTAR